VPILSDLITALNTTVSLTPEVPEENAIGLNNAINDYAIVRSELEGEKGRSEIFLSENEKLKRLLEEEQLGREKAEKDNANLRNRVGELEGRLMEEEGRRGGLEEREIRERERTEGKIAELTGEREMLKNELAHARDEAKKARAVVGGEIKRFVSAAEGERKARRRAEEEREEIRGGLEEVSVQLKEKEEQMDNVVAMMDVCRGRKAQAEEESKRWRERARELEKRLETEEGKSTTLSCMVGELQGSVKGLTERARGAQGERDEAERRAGRAEGEIEGIQEETERLRDSEIKLRVHAVPRLREEIEEMKDKVERIKRERGDWERRLKDEEREMERKKGETELLVYKLEDAEGRKEMAERREEEVRRERENMVEKISSLEVDLRRARESEEDAKGEAGKIRILLADVERGSERSAAEREREIERLQRRCDVLADIVKSLSCGEEMEREKEKEKENFGGGKLGEVEAGGGMGTTILTTQWPANSEGPPQRRTTLKEHVMTARNAYENLPPPSPADNDSGALLPRKIRGEVAGGRRKGAKRGRKKRGGDEA